MTHQQEVVVAEPRPSRLIAEALVHRHNENHVQERARAMGLCENLTHAVVSVCCRKEQTHEVHPEAGDRQYQ